MIPETEPFTCQKKKKRRPLLFFPVHLFIFCHLEFFLMKIITSTLQVISTRVYEKKEKDLWSILKWRDDRNSIYLGILKDTCNLWFILTKTSQDVNWRTRLKSQGKEREPFEPWSFLEDNQTRNSITGWGKVGHDVHIPLHNI